MDNDLLKSFDKVVSCEENYTSPYANLYKCTKLKSQEERRKILLSEQKKRRQAAVDSARGISEILKNHEDFTEVMDCSKKCIDKKYIQKKKYPFYSDKIMLAEWLEEIPEDFETNWVTVPCPKGHRVLIVSSKGKTIAVNKAGIFQNKFKSLLPGGNSESYHNTTILDCIWNSDTQHYYVLDVLAWNNRLFTDCDAEFRFFWLDSKFKEIELTITSKHNTVPFILLPNYSCIHESIKSLLSHYPVFEHIYPQSESKSLKTVNNCGLDGLLFYHKEAAYEAGHTPLAAWLKPFMVLEVLNVDIHSEYLKEIPVGYTTLSEHITHSKTLSKNWWTKGKKNMPDKMEC